MVDPETLASENGFCLTQLCHVQFFNGCAIKDENIQNNISGGGGGGGGNQFVKRDKNHVHICT